MIGLVFVNEVLRIVFMNYLEMESWRLHILSCSKFSHSFSMNIYVSMISRLYQFCYFESSCLSYHPIYVQRIIHFLLMVLLIFELICTFSQAEEKSWFWTPFCHLHLPSQGHHHTGDVFTEMNWVVGQHLCGGIASS